MIHVHQEPARARGQRRLAATLALTAAYMLAEIAGGLLTGSLALLADAGHMLTDAASLALALFAIWLAGRDAPASQTFGYHRAEILAALVNGALLLAACLWIVVEAARRLAAPPEVLGQGMLAVACGGLVVNLIAAAMLHGVRGQSLNLRGAWLHVLADLLGSLAAIAGALGVWLFNWYWADPVASIVIALLVLYSAWKLIAAATGVLMESAPRGIDVDQVAHAILRAPGVTGQHDLHIWSITAGRICLSVHVSAEADTPQTELLGKLQEMLRRDFQITHTTIQVEPDDFAHCGPCEMG